MGQTNSPLFFFTPLGGYTVAWCIFWPGLSFGVRFGFWVPNVRTIQPLGTHARMLAETALIADSLQLDTFVHSAWRTPVVLPSAVDDRRDFSCKERRVVYFLDSGLRRPQEASDPSGGLRRPRFWRGLLRPPEGSAAGHCAGSLYPETLLGRSERGRLVLAGSVLGF